MSRAYRLVDTPLRRVLAMMLAAGVLLAIAPELAPHSALDFDASAVLHPPSSSHLFGTDEFGRDVFSRILYGIAPTLGVACAGAVLGVALGTLTGLLCGYAGGLVDEAVMRWLDALLSYPGLIVAMVVIALFGAQPAHMVTALVLIFWPRSTRLVRAVVQSLARREFVAAARSRGETLTHILLRELLPNLWDVIVVDLSLRITSGILISASLAYLGLGFTPPSPAWGLMVRDGQQFIQIAPWLVVFPCLAVVAVAVATVALARHLHAAVEAIGANGV
jgi:peptide/nickel transport system permease protein